MLMYGLNLSPILAHFQKMPMNLASVSSSRRGLGVVASHTRSYSCP